MLRYCLLLLFPALTAAQPDFGSRLPLLLIDTEGQEIVDEPKITARLSVIDHSDGTLNRPQDAPTGYDGFIGIELRGSTSQTLFPKKGFGLETRDADGKDLDVALLGLPEEEDWVLHGPYSDKSLLRNALSYHLAGELMDYAPRSRLVELLVNDDYRGVYLLTEKIKRDKERVDVSKLTEDDNSGDQLTGGYLLKLDKTTGAATDASLLFLSRYGSARTGGKEVRILYDYPQPDDITDAQRQYITDFVHAFEDRLAGADFTDPVAGYRPLVDLRSFVDFFIVNEVSRNVDGYRLSSWLYKEKDSKGGKLHAGPVWDFNLAFGNADYCAGSSPTGWAFDFNEVCPDDFWQIPFWWERLREDPAFLELWRERWEKLRGEGGPLSDAVLETTVDSLAGLLADGAAERNFDRWPVLGSYVWPNDFVGEDYDSELAYLRGWIDDRMEWLDGATQALTTSTTGVGTALPLVLSPNPSPGTVSLQAPVQARVGEARVYDLLGRPLLTGQVGQRTIDLTGQPPGVYTITVMIDDRPYAGRVVLR